MNRFALRTFFVLCPVFLTTPLLPAAVNASNHDDAKGDVTAAVHQAVDDYMRQAQVKGVSIGVLANGVQYTYNFGTVESGKLSTPTSRTVYEIASLTKTFTATVLAQAVIEKRVSLDDDVRKYLKGDYPNLEYEGHPIHLADLINHHSGLPFNLPNRPEMMPGYKDLSQAEWMQNVNGILAGYTREDFFADLHKVTLEQAPGSTFKYSNAAAQLLGYILADIYGVSYSELVQRTITKPLGMRDTAIHLSHSQLKRLAIGYDDKGNAVPLYSEQSQSAAGLKSTTVDMLRYMRWEMAEIDAAVKLTHEPRVPDHDRFFALNWLTKTTDGMRTVFQSGTAPGYCSQMTFSPDSKVGVVILTNELDPAAPQKLNVMANKILHQLSLNTGSER